jgi:hypothetical protein
MTKQAEKTGSKPGRRTKQKQGAFDQQAPCFYSDHSNSMVATGFSGMPGTSR